jgi:hypothetical protein
MVVLRARIGYEVALVVVEDCFCKTMDGGVRFGASVDTGWVSSIIARETSFGRKQAGLWILFRATTVYPTYLRLDWQISDYLY